MEYSLGFTIFFGIVFLIALIMFILGIVLLVSAIVKKRPDGTRRKGMLVAGIILMVIGLGAGFISMTLGILSGVSAMTMGTPEVGETQEDLEDVFENNDKKKIYKMLAGQSVRGDEIEKEDIDELYEEMGDIDDDIEVKVYGYNSNLNFTNITYCIESFETEEGDDYTLYIDYVVKASDDDLVGIQHVMLKDGKKKVFEAGVAPNTDNNN